MCVIARRPARLGRPGNTEAHRTSFTAATSPSEGSAGVNPHRRGGTVVFEIYFTSAMTGANVELLRRQLGMTTHLDRKLPVDPNSPGFARLDQDSGLFLEQAAGEGRWVLQARTWDAPPLLTIHEWHVRTAMVVRQLDPGIALPERAPVGRLTGLRDGDAASREGPARPRVANVAAGTATAASDGRPRLSTPTRRAPHDQVVERTQPLPSCCRSWIAEQGHHWWADHRWS